MLVLVVVLVATNLISLGVLAWYLLRPADEPAPDDQLAASLNAALRPSASSSGTRRLITIEILNPIELAGTRGRLAGIAGSLAPGITRRVVYEQALKMVRRHLTAERVVADVRLHVTRPAESPTRGAGPLPAAAGPPPASGPAPVVDASATEPVDLVKRPDEVVDWRDNS